LAAGATGIGTAVLRLQIFFFFKSLRSLTNDRSIHTDGVLCVFTGGVHDRNRHCGASFADPVFIVFFTSDRSIHTGDRLQSLLYTCILTKMRSFHKVSSFVHSQTVGSGHYRNRYLSASFSELISMNIYICIYFVLQ